ncbi:hypothetical protein HXX25_01330 [Hyphobacterium sp. CCMP332]|jgi:hypothetical protein|uniref:hypothetical protein n=1 Tax=Hyphobacterium sp. CCMP332 TaxID=2749086 RepID=UPI00165088D9|nr:hypothetical protein [Hyphobacterium sp. CCMP332]QNL18095.1 hypothetical protein HXX25_01330 [Hyphobacterium sp. CCMP332]
MLELLVTAALSTAPFNPAVPAEFQFGEPVNAHDFSVLCESHTVRELDPAEMPLAMTRHVQVDCDGYDYFGAGRLAEFVFADGALTHVWVLVEDSDLDPLQAAFVEAFGTPDAQAPVFAAFFEQRAAVRRDVPEALYYSESAEPLFEGFFSQ